jgi:glycerophosphoryl diester phosphodiesterase
MLFKTNSIIGHRGCRGCGPQENTIEAFTKAIADGADYLEMDIRRTRDGALVVFHNAEICGARLRGNLFADLKKVAEINKLQLPTLEEILQALKGKSKLLIELKETGYENEVVDSVLKYFTTDEFLIISFFDEAVVAVKKKYPTVKTGLLLGQKRRGGPEGKEPLWHYLKRRNSEFCPWRRLQKCGADFLLPNYSLLIFGMHKWAVKRGLPIITWAVNDPRMLKFLMQSHALNGIATDQPELAVKIRKML